MDCKLQVFKNEFKERHSGWAYRFVVIDNNSSKNYPANFVCMLPIKVYKGKVNSSSAFEELFGERSLDLAIVLLSDALKTEKDAEVKGEIEKRLKLIDPKQVNVVKCSQCKKEFQLKKTRKYKQYLCAECLTAKYGQKQH